MLCGGLHECDIPSHRDISHRGIDQRDPKLEGINHLKTLPKSWRQKKAHLRIFMEGDHVGIFGGKWSPPVDDSPYRSDGGIMAS